MTQTALEIDGLMPPFWAEVWRYHIERRVEDDELHDLLLTCNGGEEYGEHHVVAIGDQKGDLWRRSNISTGLGWLPTERAPWPSPYAKLGSDL